MHKLEDGIHLDVSEIYFLQPSQFAEDSLYYLQHLGVFECDTRYVVTHPYWESIQIMFIDEGELEVAFRDEMFVAKKNDIVILDCRYEHIYHAQSNFKFHYIHFAGSSSFEYASLLYELNQSALLENACTDTLNSAFQNLRALARSQTNAQNEHRISVYLHMVLCELAESCYSIPATANELIEQSIRFMEEHITESVSLDEIAAHINLSKYYFNRLFSKHIGMTPHRYFTNLRIQRAKRLLMTTSASVEEVSAQGGFDTSCNFIRLFKQRTGMTPTAFRKIPF